MALLALALLGKQRRTTRAVLATGETEEDDDYRRRRRQDDAKLLVLRKEQGSGRQADRRPKGVHLRRMHRTLRKYPARFLGVAAGCEDSKRGSGPGGRLILRYGHGRTAFQAQGDLFVQF